MGAVNHSFFKKSKNLHDGDNDDEYFNIMFYYFFSRKKLVKFFSDFHIELPQVFSQQPQFLFAYRLAVICSLGYGKSQLMYFDSTFFSVQG